MKTVGGFRKSRYRGAQRTQMAAWWVERRITCANGEVGGLKAWHSATMMEREQQMHAIQRRKSLFIALDAHGFTLGP